MTYHLIMLFAIIELVAIAFFVQIGASRLAGGQHMANGGRHDWNRGLRPECPDFE